MVVHIYLNRGCIFFGIMNSIFMNGINPTNLVAVLKREYKTGLGSTEKDRQPLRDQTGFLEIFDGARGLLCVLEDLFFQGYIKGIYIAVHNSNLILFGGSFKETGKGRAYVFAPNSEGLDRTLELLFAQGYEKLINPLK